MKKFKYFDSMDIIIGIIVVILFSFIGLTGETTDGVPYTVDEIIIIIYISIYIGVCVMFICSDFRGNLDNIDKKNNDLITSHVNGNSLENDELNFDTIKDNNFSKLAMDARLIRKKQSEISNKFSSKNFR